MASFSSSRPRRSIRISPLEAATWLFVWETNLADGRISPQQLTALQPLVAALRGLAAFCQPGKPPYRPTTRHPTVV